MTRVLMVCLGNICRSPMAEGILRHKAEKAGLNMLTDSCGTSGFHRGEQADVRTINTLKKYGIDISDLRARQLKMDDFELFDYILVMDELNYNDVIQSCPNEGFHYKVKLILDYAPETGRTVVPDPYFGSQQDFEKVYNLLDVSIDAFIKTLK